MKVFENTQKKQLYICVIVATFVFGLIAHGYCYFNLTYSHDSLLTYQNDIEWQISIGRYLHPIYYMIRGKVYAPTLVGVLSLLYLSATEILILNLLEIEEKGLAVLISGILTTNTTVTLLNATYIHDVDVYMLALLFAVGGVFVCRKFKYGFVGGILFITCACALYQSFFQVAVFLYLILAIKDILDEKKFSQVILAGLKGIIMLVLGLALYYVGMKVCIHVWKIDATDFYNSANNVGIAKFANLSYLYLLLFASRLYVFSYFENPIIANSQLVSKITVIMLILTIAMLVRIIVVKKIKWQNIILLLLLLLMIPYGMNIVYVIAEGTVHHLMIYSFFVLYVFIIWVHKCNLGVERKRLNVKWINVTRSFLIPVLVVVFLFNSIVYANQIYLKKELEQQNTLSTMTRIIDRIEQIEDYIPGDTPVAIVGNLEQSEMAKKRNGFDYTGTGLGCNFSVTYYVSYQWYFENYLSYPINLVSEDEAAEFSGMPEVIEMPSFPSVGCCKMVNGTLVVRLS